MIGLLTAVAAHKMSSKLVQIKNYLQAQALITPYHYIFTIDGTLTWQHGDIIFIYETI